MNRQFKRMNLTYRAMSTEKTLRTRHFPSCSQRSGQPLSLLFGVASIVHGAICQKFLSHFSGELWDPTASRSPVGPESPEWAPCPAPQDIWEASPRPRLPSFVCPSVACWQLVDPLTCREEGINLFLQIVSFWGYFRINNQAACVKNTQSFKL